MTPRSRRVVRRRRPVQDANATSEVAVEDILLEVYAEDPPPPPSRRVSPMPPMAGASPHESTFATSLAIASVVPPPPVQSAAVDALLRASDPAFAFNAPTWVPPQGQGFVQGRESHPSLPPMPTYQYDSQSLSVAPVMLASSAPPALTRPIVGTVRTKRPNRAGVLAIWAVVIMVLGIAAGVGVIGVRNGTYARLREGASRRIGATSPAAQPVAPRSAQPVAPSPALTPANDPVVAPAAPAAPPTPSVAVDSLPKPSIPADVSLVTLPSYAHGHRVFVDGRVVTIADDGPTRLKCGRHMIKIGTARRPRVFDLTCGSEFTIR